MEEALVDIKTVQKRSGLPLSWLYQAAENGIVPSYKLGKYVKFRLSEVETWIQAQKRQGPPAGTNGTPPKRVRPVVVVAKPRRHTAAR